MALSPVAINPNGTFQYGRQQVEIDEELLKEIADATGGRYFRATDNKKLAEIYNEINKLEKTEVEERKYYNYEEKYQTTCNYCWITITIRIFIKNHNI